jgi:hypothetical protein
MYAGEYYADSDGYYPGSDDDAPDAGARMMTIEQRQVTILADDPYAAREHVLAMALAQEHAWMCAWVPGHSGQCAHWSEHVNR